MLSHAEPELSATKPHLRKLSASWQLLRKLFATVHARAQLNTALTPRASRGHKKSLAAKLGFFRSSYQNGG